jgi:hypothetical protein
MRDADGAESDIERQQPRNITGTKTASPAEGAWKVFIWVRIRSAAVTSTLACIEATAPRRTPGSAEICGISEYGTSGTQLR